MIAFGHSAIGAAVGLTIYQKYIQTDPILGLVITPFAGIVSHYIADFIPHGHFVPGKKIKRYLVPILIFDVFLSVFLFLWASFNHSGLDLKFLYIFFGIGGSLLPDVITGLVGYGRKSKNILLRLEHDIHMSTHWHGKYERALLLGWLDIWQVLTIVLSFYWVITF